MSCSASVPIADAELPRLPPGFMPRPRLVDLFETLAGADLLIVSALTGSGKTSQLTHWARHRSAMETVVWVGLDRGQELTAPVLWDSLAGALERAGFDGVDSEARAAASIAAAINRYGEPIRIFVDDLEVADPSIEHELVRLAALLQRGSLVVATRSADTLRSELFGVQAHLATVTAADLAFTTTETDDLLGGSGSPALGAADIHRATGGHALLTRLIVASGSSTMAAAALTASDWVRTAIGPDRFEFAVHIALAFAVDAALARRITGDESAAEILDSLAGDGLGIVDHRGMFRYHDLIGATLRDHAASALPEPARRRAQSLAADHLSTRRGHASAALRLLAQSGRTTELWPFVASRFTTLIRDVPALRAALDEVPAETVTADGTLGAIAAITQGMSERCPPSSRLRDLTSVALHELRSRPPATDGREAVVRQLAVLTLSMAAQDLDDSTAEVDRLGQIVAGLSPATRLRLAPFLEPAHLVVATALVLAGDMYGAERVLGALDADPDRKNTNGMYIQRAYICAMRGEVSTAADIIETHIERRPQSVLWSSRLGLTQAIILLETGQLAAANELLGSLEDDLPTVPDWANLLFVITRAHIATDPVAGIEHVDRLLAIHDSRPATRAVRDLLDSGVADLAVAAGDIQRAVKLVERRTPRDVALRVAAARLGLVTGDLSYVDDLRDLLAGTEVWTRRRVHALFVMSIGLHRLGNTAQAGAALHRALAIAKQNGIRLIQALVPRAELDAIASQAGLHVPANVNDADPLAELLPPVQLTNREEALLRQLATRRLLREIADADFVTLSTIKSQAASVYRKRGVHSRQEAVEAARERGLLPDP